MNYQNKKFIFENIDKGVKPLVGMIFRYIDSEKKKKQTKAQVLERIEHIIKYLGIDRTFSRYILELYMLNYRSDGDYSNLTKGNFIDPRKQKAKRTSNVSSDLYTKVKLPFEGSNLRGYWDKDYNGEEYYVVVSYGWYPVYIFKDDKWYENSKRYSSSTSKQMYRSNPVSDYNKDINERVILATPDQMKMLMQKGGLEDVLKDKKIQITKKEAEFISSRLRTLRIYIPSVNVKYKVKSVKAEPDDKIKVFVDIYDVIKRENGISIPTTQNYLNDEIPGVTKESVEQELTFRLANEFREFLGPRLHWEEKPTEQHFLNFEFNHLKK